MKAVQKFTGVSGGQDSVNFSRKRGYPKGHINLLFISHGAWKMNSGKPRHGVQRWMNQDPGSLLPQDQPPYCMIADEHSFGID